MSEPVKVVVIVQFGVMTGVLSGVELDVVTVDYDEEARGGGDVVLGRMFSDGTFVRDFMNAASTKEQS